MTYRFYVHYEVILRIFCVFFRDYTDYNKILLDGESPCDSKSAIFNGTLTVKDASDNTLVTIGTEEISPRFKVVSLWPTPSSNTIYMEYYKKIKELNHDHESPEFDPKWHHVVRVGTLAKVYEYLGRESEKITTAAWYQKLVRAMVSDDELNADYIPYLKRRDPRANANVRLHLSEDVIS